eukprot:SAG31_NODE_32608_length_353_cov_1.224409_2_plen_42_part_01
MDPAASRLLSTLRARVVELESAVDEAATRVAKPPKSGGKAGH